MQYKHIKPFPDGFLWGASTSAFQCEGAYNEDGKKPSIQETLPYPEHLASFKDTVDHYHRFREDIALMAEMGFRAYRFSIPWTRIIPDGRGPVNRIAVDHYNEVINECLKYGIKPIVTLYHFDTPASIQEEYGGFESRRMIDDFSAYCTVCFKEFGDRVKHWTVNNEYNSFAMEILSLSGFGPSSHSGRVFENYEEHTKYVAVLAHHALVAESKVIGICRTMWPDALIGPTVNTPPGYAASSKPEDQLAAMDSDTLHNWYYLDVACAGHYNPQVLRYLEDNNALPDITEEDLKIIRENNANWISVNYYQPVTVAAAGLDTPTRGMSMTDNGGADNMNTYALSGVYTGQDNPNLTKSEYGWELDPVGMRIILDRIASRYNLPMIITENGLGCADVLTEDGRIHDDYRIDFLRKHIEQCRLAINDGANLIGYCPWSAIDLISTHQGMRKRYGFIYVNRDEKDLKDLARIRKDSFFWYQNVIRTNGNEL